MKHDTKVGFLRVAELIDAWRLVPRIIVLGYCWWVYHVTDFVLKWYTHDPTVAQSVTATGAVAAIFATVTGFAPWIFKIYMDTGRDWQANPAPVENQLPSANNNGTQQ